MFKSKHKLDLGIVSFDQRGKEVLGFSETEFAAIGIYDIVHPEDLAYVASAHQECKSMPIRRVSHSRKYSAFEEKVSCFFTQFFRKSAN